MQPLRFVKTRKLRLSFRYSAVIHMNRLFAHGAAANVEGAVDVSLLMGQQLGHILSERKSEKDMYRFLSSSTKRDDGFVLCFGPRPAVVAFTIVLHISKSLVI